MSSALPRLHVRGRLFVGSIVVVTLVIGVSGVFAEIELRRWLEARIESELETQLHAARFAVELDPATPDDAFADRLGEALRARLTVIDANGVVVGDSDVEPARLPFLENHATRPEVMQAVGKTDGGDGGDGSGRGRRKSVTVGKEMLYLAERFERPAATEPVPALRSGVVRVAADYDDVDKAVGKLRALLAMAGGLGLLAAVAMSALASQLLSRTLRSLVVYARTLAGGGAGGRGGFDDGDDIGGVAGTLQRLADSLGRSVDTLASERDRFAAVLEAMSEGVIALDKDAGIVLINQAARDMFRVLDDPTGRALLEVARAPALVDVAGKARAGEVASVEIELIGRTLRTVLVRAAPTRNGGAVIVMHDVTDVRRLERVRRDFVSNVSHELRTPVSVIRASAETLLAGADGDEARRFVEAIERNATRLTRLVADLLDLSRIESGQVPLLREPLRLAELCRRAVENVDAEARKAHEIVVEVPEEMTAAGDPKAVDQVLVNLLNNAVAYTPPGSHVRIRALVVADEGAPPAVRVEVADDGAGIAAQHRERLFERFYRVDTGRSRDVGGTGLGLAIVKHLVEAMGGRVGVLPVVPRGALFWFTLPTDVPSRHRHTTDTIDSR